MDVDLIVLNYNGERLLTECLPSVVAAGAASRHRCRTVVVDNASTDGSLDVLRRRFPGVEVLRSPNDGLCSFNAALAHRDAPIALLLNNDIQLHPAALDPLVEPLVERPDCFFTAPRCYLFDGSYDGFKTSVAWRWGLLQATALFAGHAAGITTPGQTASAGAALAVDRMKFLRLGGFDPLYLPGRLEDLDLAFRGYQSGYYGLYVPDALCYHVGMATFGKVFGPSGCDDLALRNTLLFIWKNLRCGRHLARHAAGLALRLVADVAAFPVAPPWRRWRTWRALIGAIAAWRTRHSGKYAPRRDRRRERAFFDRFHPAALAAEAGPSPPVLAEPPTRSTAAGRPTAAATWDH